MKQLFTFLFSISIIFSFGQVTVTSDVTHTYNGWMHVFNLSGGAKDTPNFNSAWGVASLKTTITSAGTGGFTNGAITLQPNFNGYADNPGDAFWRDNNGAGPGGNKWMEAITYVEYAANTYPGGDLTFKADINSNTLDSGYTAIAFIKTLDPNNGHATVINQTVPLGTTGSNFTVTATGINTAHIVQYGFVIEGINANPANETALGSVIVTPDTTVLGVGDVVDSSFSVYPNPINDIIEIRAAQAVHHVRIHDLTGKEVLRAAPNQAHFTLNTSALGKGVYLLSVVSDGNESTAKLVK